MKRIILIGYMGAGKTTIGMTLSRLTSMQFIDLDQRIENHFQQRISEMFATKGEDIFRQREHEMLKEVLKNPNVIIATGGGTPCFYDNMKLMNEQAETVFLNCKTQSIIEHLHISHSSRPLLDGKTDEELKMFIQNSINDRIRYYSQAQHVIDIPTLHTKEDIEEIAKKIAELCNISLRHSS